MCSLQFDVRVILDRCDVRVRPNSRAFVAIFDFSSMTRYQYSLLPRKEHWYPIIMTDGLAYFTHFPEGHTCVATYRQLISYCTSVCCRTISAHLSSVQW